MKDEKDCSFKIMYNKWGKINTKYSMVDLQENALGSFIKCRWSAVSMIDMVTFFLFKSRLQAVWESDAEGGPTRTCHRELHPVPHHEWRLSGEKAGEDQGGRVETE